LPSKQRRIAIIGITEGLPLFLILAVDLSHNQARLTFDAALERGNKDIVELLLLHGAPVNFDSPEVRTVDAETPILTPFPE
jgi:hypothetical protein